MAQLYYMVLTAIGAAKKANKEALGLTVDLTELAVGDGDGVYVAPDQTWETLINEVDRVTINQIYQDPDNPTYLVVEAIVPQDVPAGYYIREVGIFDADGDMIMVGAYPQTYKPTLAEGAARDLYIRAISEIGNSDSVELKIDPSIVLATRKYVEDAIKSHVPIGVEFPWYKDTAPDGYLIEDGALYSMTAYHEMDLHFDGTTALDAGVTCTFDDAADKALAVAHGLTDDTIIRCTNAGGLLPAALTARYTRYYIVNATADDFQLAVNKGGAAIALADAGAGIHSFHEKLAVPNPRGRGIRITDGGAGIDPDAATRTDRGDGVGGDVPGSKQGPGIADHNHQHTDTSTWGSGGTGPGTHWSGEVNSYGNYTGTFPMENPDSETRMINEGRHLIIRAY